MEKLRKLWKKFINPETISYLIFGVLTTVINILVFMFCYEKLHWNEVIANTVAWTIAVIFAFITNKLYVFKSKSFEVNIFWRELITFLVARLLSLGVDDLGIWLLVGVNHANDLISKIAMNVIVVIINYVLSKLIIFKKK